jgi:hypothetical protein
MVEFAPQGNDTNDSDISSGGCKALHRGSDWQKISRQTIG